jgi:hypothetical protein
LLKFRYMGDEQTKKSNTKRRRRILLPASILIIITLAIFLFIKNMNGPAEGAISQVQPTASNIKNPQAAQGKYNGQYISFNYPGSYKIVPLDKSGGIIETVRLSNTDHSGKYVNIGVVREALTNDSGINYRAGHPDLYKQLSKTADSIVFLGTQPRSEQTGFIAHNGIVVSISITANGVRNLSHDYDTIANSLNWK